MALTFNQLQSLTTDKFLPKVIDNIFNSTAMIKRIMRPKHLRLKDGGEKIRGPVVNSKPTGNNGWYSGSDTLVQAETDNITAFQVEWRQYYEAIKISHRELLQNNGDSAKLNLLMSKMQIAQDNIIDALGTGIFSLGTNDIIDGLQAIISATSTYGGIAVADMSTWAATVKSNPAGAGTDRAVTLNLMQEAMGAATIDSKKPTAATCVQAVYDQVWALFQPAQRLMSEEMGKLGFSSVLEFNGIPLIVDSHMKAGSIYFINENHTYLTAHSKRNMEVVSFEHLETFDGILKRIMWMGNMVCEARRLNSELADIEVSS